tara:strand:+ start:1909 stop:2160 length:252 start_codon:yes stop_codon:yes gene_type:complete
MKQNDRAIVLEAILSERERQDASFGEQNHDDSWWNLLITQRQGEVAKELFSYSETKLFIELIQTCATYMSWAECVKRRLNNGK